MEEDARRLKLERNSFELSRKVFEEERAQSLRGGKPLRDIDNNTSLHELLITPAKAKVGESDPGRRKSQINEAHGRIFEFGITESPEPLTPVSRLIKEARLVLSEGDS